MPKIGIFVETPLQLLCAFEAMELRGGGKEIQLFLRATGRGRNDKQLIETARILGLDFKLIRFNVKATLLDRARLLLVIISLLSSKYDEVYFGSFFSGFFRILARHIRSKKTFYLDDGMATLLAQRSMKAGGAKDLFTFFNIEPLPGQEVIMHGFEGLKKKIGYSRGNEAYFIGQPLVDYGYLNVDEYCACVKDAVRKVCGGDLYYVPHRHESEAMQSRISGIDGVSLREVATPIELYFISSGIYPRFIFSFSSTALVSIKLIYPDCTSISYFIDYKNYSPRTHIEDIYCFFEEEAGIEVIDVRSSATVT